MWTHIHKDGEQKKWFHMPDRAPIEIGPDGHAVGCNCAGSRAYRARHGLAETEETVVRTMTATGHLTEIDWKAFKPSYTNLNAFKDAANLPKMKPVLIQMIANLPASMASRT